MGTKVTIPPLGNPLNSSFTTELNNDLDELGDEFDNVVYRDGSQSMLGDLNMNSNRVYNLPPALLGHEAVNLDDVLSLISEINTTGAIGGVINYTTRTNLANATVSVGSVGHLGEGKREGFFVLVSAADFLNKYGITLASAIASDTLQGIYVPLTGDPTGATSAWVRAGDVLTPYMFGGLTNYCYGSRPLGTYGESFDPNCTNNSNPNAGVLVDSRLACQAVLDAVSFHKNRHFVANFSDGIWGLTKRSDGGFNDLDGLVINQHSEFSRTFIGGDFRGIGTGRNLIYVDEGGYCVFDGVWHLRTAADLSFGLPYASRTWEDGIWLRNSAESRWNIVKTASFLRWGIEYDPEYNILDYNNNIGSRFKEVYGGGNGSAVDRGTNSFDIAFTASSRTGSSNSYDQRTNWTLAAGHEILRTQDIVRGPNGQYHVIMEKAGNVISVYPWNLSVAASGTLTSCHGGSFRVQGKDVAGAGADHLVGVSCGSTLDARNCLHGPAFDNIIQEGGGLGTFFGTINGVNLGTFIGKMHSEANTLDLLCVGGTNCEVFIGCTSAWANQDPNDPWKLTEVLAPNDGATVPTNTGLPQVILGYNGTWWNSGSILEGFSSLSTKSRTLGAYQTVLSNNPGNNAISAVQPAGLVSNITLKYHERTDRFQKNGFIAALDITGASGGAPTDTITVTLDATDVSAGIQFVNGTTASTYVITGGTATGPVRLLFFLDTNFTTLRWVILPLRGVPSSIGGGELVNNSVTNTQLRQGGATTVIGRAANTTGNVADIAAGADNTILRRTGGTLNFGAVDLSTVMVTGTLVATSFPILTGDVTTAGGALVTTIANNAVSNAKLRDSAALSVIGNSTNGTADPADIAAGADFNLLRRSGTTIGFGSIDLSQAGAVGTSRLPRANQVQVTASRLIGNPTGSTADESEISLAADLAFSGTSLQIGAFTGDISKSAGSLATTIVANGVTYAKFQQVAASSLVGNPTGSLANAQGITLAGGLAFSGTTLTAAGALTPTSVASTGAVTSSSATAGVGYASGARGTQTQLTSKSTGVTSNTVVTDITLNGAALAAATTVSFVFTNSSIGANDTLILQHVTTGTFGAYTLNAHGFAAGSCTIDVTNRSAGSLSEAIVIRAVVIKGG